MTLLEQLAAARLVAVVTRVPAAHAVALGAALVRGGLPFMEVTLRAPGAIDAIRAVAADPPDGLVLGAGTVLTAAQVDIAVDAGARYVVAPGISVAVIERCRERGVPCFPGAATPTDVMQALDHGLEILKFFPAEALGGVTTLRAIAAPFPDVRWVPTGGIGPANLADYLAIPSVVAVGGSWMVRPELIDAGRLDEIERLAAEASALALAAPGAAR